MLAALARAAPHIANVYLQWAPTPLARGDVATGLDLLDKALALAPNLPLAHYNKARVLLEAARADEALGSIRSVIALASAFGPAYELLAVAHAARGETAQSTSAIDRARQLQPNAPGPWITLGEINKELGHFEEALSAGQRALQLDPKSARALICCAHAAQLLKRWGQALAYFERAAALDRNVPGLLGDLNFARGMLCEWDGAEECAAWALEAVARDALPANPWAFMAFATSPALQLRVARRFARGRLPARGAAPRTRANTTRSVSAIFPRTFARMRRRFCSPI